MLRRLIRDFRQLHYALKRFFRRRQRRRARLQAGAYAQRIMRELHELDDHDSETFRRALEREQRR